MHVRRALSIVIAVKTISTCGGVHPQIVRLHGPGCLPPLPEVCKSHVSLLPLDFRISKSGHPFPRFFPYDLFLLPLILPVIHRVTPIPLVSSHTYTPERSHVRLRGGDESVRTTDFGIVPTVGVGISAAIAHDTRSPPEAGRRYVSTASGLGYVTSVTAAGSTGGGQQLGSPALSPPHRSSAGAGGGGYFWRRDTHLAAVPLSSRRESRGEMVLLDRLLPEGENNFVIVVEEEDAEGETDSDGDLDAGSVDEGNVCGGSLAPPAPASGVVVGERPQAVLEQLQPQPMRSLGAGLSMTAALIHLNSGRFLGGNGGGGSGGSGGGGSGSIALASPPPATGSGTGLHL